MRKPSARLLLLLTTLAPMLSGCGVDLAFSALWNAGQQAKAAKNAVKQQEEAKTKVLEAIDTATKNRSAAMKDVQAQVDGSAVDPANPSAPAAPPAETSAAMKAAEEQTK